MLNYRCLQQSGKFRNQKFFFHKNIKIRSERNKKKIGKLRKVEFFSRIISFSWKNLSSFLPEISRDSRYLFLQNIQV